MTGFVFPDWVRKGRIIMVNGEPKKVIDSYVAGKVESHYENSDVPMVQFNGEEQPQEFDRNVMGPITMGKRPRYLQEGQFVNVRGFRGRFKIAAVYYTPPDLYPSGRAPIQNLSLVLERQRRPQNGKRYTSRETIRYKTGAIRPAPARNPRRHGAATYG